MEFHVDDVFETPRWAHFTVEDVPLLQSALTKKSPLTRLEQRALNRALRDWEGAHEIMDRTWLVAQDAVVNNLEEAP